MTEIKLYQPGKYNLDVQFPTEWNDFNIDELVYAAINVFSGQLDLAEFLLFILRNRVKNKLGKKAHWVVEMIDPEQLYIDGLALLDFVKGDIKLTKLPYAYIATFPAPKEMFEDFTCLQFEHSEFYQIEYNNNPTEENLNKLVFSIFDKGYNKIRAKWLHKRLELMSIERKLVVYLWFIGCKNELPEYFDTLFSGAAKSKMDDMTGNEFTHLIHAAAGPKNGTRDQIRKTLLMELLLDLDLELKKSATHDS